MDVDPSNQVESDYLTYLIICQHYHPVTKRVTTRWHHNLVDVRSLIIEEWHSMRVHGVKYHPKSVVAKIARFEFEVPQVETETALYQVIDGHGIGPAFLGHLIEHSRVIGFLTERIEGHPGGISDLGPCQAVVERLHSSAVFHGDLNRHNFIVPPSGATLIDFENARKSGSKEAMQKKLALLAEHLTKETYRGSGCIRESDRSDT